tara:strand:- start:214 stop:492 length:279 start_codon:yes stop_codon:yes gene_type:complete
MRPDKVAVKYPPGAVGLGGSPGEACVCESRTVSMVCRNALRVPYLHAPESTGLGAAGICGVKDQGSGVPGIKLGVTPGKLPISTFGEFITAE